jgi:hypothetical protein
MPDSTANLALPYILPAQAQKHVTHNESLNALDAVIQLSITSRALSAPPVNPGEGSRYIVATGASGDWTAQTGSIAVYQDGAWLFHAPRDGWRAWLQEEESLAVFANGTWIEPAASHSSTPFGAYTRLQTVEENLDLLGSMTQASFLIPNRAIVLAVSVRVIDLIVGPTAFNVGVNGEDSIFGGNLGTDPSTTNVGVIGPTAFYAPTAIELVPVDGAFTSGSVHLVLHFIECGPALN